MSGFFGLLRQDGETIERKLLEAVAQELSVRGPDGTGIWSLGGVGGCFTFLRTGPAKQSEQQAVKLGDRYWLTGDVRLDARRELLDQLFEGEGKLTQDLTNEELLLLAWSKWGAECLERVIGDFSFALWDEDEHCLWCARDFSGARPFYYALVGGVLCFSNTLQVLLKVPKVSAQLDDSFVGDFLLEGWCADLTRTVYRDIRRLAPGHLLKYSQGQVTVTRFLKLPIEEPLHLKGPEEYIEAYRELLTQAVNDRLPESAALYLSGGLDSSSVSAIAARLAAERGHLEKLKAFTISWEPLFSDDEASFAKLTAKELGIAHEVVQDPDVLPYGNGATEPEATPEPNHDMFFERSQRRSRKIASFSRVVLTGDGGDDVLAGQAWPYLAYLGKRGEWGGIVKRFGGYIRTHGQTPPLRAGFRSKVKSWLSAKNKFADYPRWLNDEFEGRLQLRQRWLDLQGRRQVYEHPVHPAAYASLHAGYWSSVLESEDPGWTRIPLETRAPLLDLRLLRFLLRVPPVPWCAHKELSRRAMAGYLPEAVLRRAKTPLPRDPLQVCREKERWRPTPVKKPAEHIYQYVNWQEWSATLTHDKGSLSWVNLRPMTLALWLKGIENGRAFK